MAKSISTMEKQQDGSYKARLLLGKDKEGMEVYRVFRGNTRPEVTKQLLQAMQEGGNNNV